jgi:HSP20 family protein
MSDVPARRESARPMRWDPFADFGRLEQQLNQLMRGWPTTAWPAVGFTGTDEFAPLADIEENDDAYEVDIELAGIDKKDISVELAGRRLAVSGERKERERTGVLRHKTRAVGEFRYELLLPGDVDEEKVEASLAEGVLTVRCPKAATERPRRITVS